VVDLLHQIVEEGTSRGASFVEARLQLVERQAASAENGVFKGFSNNIGRGVGLRVLYGGAWGFSSTTSIERASLLKALETAMSIARASSAKAKKAGFAPAPATRASVRSSYREDPFEVDEAEKADLVLKVNKHAMSVDGVVGSITALGLLRDERVYVNSEGSEVVVGTVAVGLRQAAVAKHAGQLEQVGDQDSRVSGYEFIRSGDWIGFSEEVATLASMAAKAKPPKAGSFPVVLDNEVVGLLLHEAFGHASEGDGVEVGFSVLKDKVGSSVASDLVTIVDEGVVEGGYYVPFDDEGVRKERTVVVENGVLRGFLHSRLTAGAMGARPTGNARAQDFANVPIVRQTNYYMLPGDFSVEELFEHIKLGYYVKGRGARGGEVNPGLGTFTFNVGPSYLIVDGEVKELVRSVSISGSILDTLKTVEAVARDLKVTTSVFGACGKDGQRVHVGDGGPHIRVGTMVVGGSG